ncbi:MAG: hypothetical protein R3194_00375 [Limnobacter sp.]|nr:hypothetical protein [Limnobacter sp.]
MFELILAVSGFVAGLLLGIWMLRVLLRIPSARILLADWMNWNQVEMPPTCKQVIRHGKWVAHQHEEH